MYDYLQLPLVITVGKYKSVGGIQGRIFARSVWKKEKGAQGIGRVLLNPTEKNHAI